MTVHYIRLKWDEMDSDNSGAGAPDESYSLIYEVSFREWRTNWATVRQDIRRLVTQYFADDPDADRLGVDDYIIRHLADNNIMMRMVDAETLVIK